VLINSLKKILVWAIIQASNAGLIVLEKLTRRISASETTQRQSILIIRTQAVGDFLLSLPAIDAIAKANPKETKILLIPENPKTRNADKLRAYTNQKFIWSELLPDGLIAETHLLPLTLDGVKSLKQKLAIAIKGVKTCYLVGENIVNPIGIFKKIILLRFIGYRGTIYGIKIRAIPSIFPESQIGEARLEHHLVALLRTVSECPKTQNKAQKPPTFPIKINEKIKHNVKKHLLQFNGTNSPRLVAVAPGSILDFKRWPIENFKKTARFVLEKYDVNLLIIGTQSELEFCKELSSDLGTESRYSGRILNLCGKTSIAELAGILEQTSLLISNDGGSCHLAAAVNCPVISIANGAEIPNSVEPWGYQHLTVRHNTECSPCYSFTHCPKGTKKCVNQISPEVVINKIIKCLQP